MKLSRSCIHSSWSFSDDDMVVKAVGMVVAVIQNSNRSLVQVILVCWAVQEVSVVVAKKEEAITFVLMLRVGLF